MGAQGRTHGGRRATLVALAAKPPAGGAKEADDQGPVQSEDGGAKAGDGETGTSGGGEW